MRQGRRGEVNQKALRLILAGNNACLGQSCDKGGGEWSDSRCILKVRQMEFANQSMFSVRKREVKDGSKDFFLR